MLVVEARNFLHPQGLIVESAYLLAEHVSAHLNDGDEIEISFVGVKGVPSSYFNVVLRQLVDQFGSNILQRVKFRFGTAAQRFVFDRSLHAVSGALT